MKIKKYILILLFSISFDALACQCPSGEYETIEYAFKSSKWVFVGTYQKEEFDKVKNVRKGYFEITNKIKGDFSQFGSITRPVVSGGGMSCFSDITVGMEYVVFVPPSRKISACNLSRPFVPESKNEYYVYSPKTVEKLEQLAN